jgi:hypothetical protein
MQVRLAISSFTTDYPLVLNGKTFRINNGKEAKLYHEDIWGNGGIALPILIATLDGCY